jgi:hypothetical protein
MSQSTIDKQNPRYEFIEVDKKLSESQLWQLQENFFEHSGLDAWPKVPFYSTSRMPFCEAYADMVLAFMLEYAEHLDFYKPLYIIELGGGTGCFTYRFLNLLVEKKGRFPFLDPIHIRHVLTDFTPSIVDGWKSIAQLQEQVERGILDFAVFKPEADQTIRLEVEGTTLDDKSFENPVIVIANYFFDTLRHDAFRISGKELQETRISLYRDGGECNLIDPVKLEDLRIEEQFKKCNSAYYGDPKLDGILDYYRANLTDASVIFPIGSFRSINNILRLSKNRVVLLAADKGFTSTESRQIKGLWPQRFTAHGSISFDVNFNALERYFQALGGQAFVEGGDHFSLCFFLGTTLTNKLESLSDYFTRAIAERDLVNSYYNLEALVHQALRLEQTDGSCLPLFLSLVKTFAYEPVVFSIVFHTMETKLTQELNKVDEEMRLVLVQLFKRVWQNIYFFEENFSVLDGIFRCLFAMGCVDELLKLCEKSNTIFGPLTTILDHSALCHELLGNFEQSYEFFSKSCDQMPEHLWALEGKQRLAGMI